MPITSVFYWIFVLLVFLLLLIGNKLLKTDEKRVIYAKCVLLIASYGFIACADIRFALVLFALTVVSYLGAKSRRNMKAGIVISLLALGYFKYADFFVSSFSRIFGGDNVALNIILPLGISFYTFGAIGYMVDVNRREIERRSLLDLALYLSFFPKLTSGPIQRGADFFEQIDRPRLVSVDSLLVGVQIFCFGLFKKIVLADRLSVFVNQVFETPAAFGGGTVFLAVTAYSLQIYFDFSGYSDMAVGSAKMLDITLPRNFNLPYLSRNVTEFWKRWHITLSQWLQNYLYIPLGGNRKGKIRTYANLILTMLIGGLWHGASTTFILWGLFHGIALVVHKIWMTKTGSSKKDHSVFSNIICTLTTFAFVSFCWIFFRAETPARALEIIKVMFSFRRGIAHPYLWFFAALSVCVVSSIVAAIHGRGQVTEIRRKNTCRVNGFYPVLNLNTFVGLVMFFVFCGLIFGLAYTGGSPFIYGAY